MKRSRVNVLSVVNSASNITTETINGRPHIVVHGVTPIVDDIVMNGKLYTAAEIAKGYKTLERTPMPLGHPKVDGKYVSARDVQAVNEYHVGAWFQNAEHKDGKVSGDMYVDRRYAEATEKGKRLVNRLDDMAAGKSAEPIHISTGLMYSGITANGESKGKKYREIVTNMAFDHVANLLDEPGAGTPEEGVGIFVNSDGSEQEIEVVNLADAEQCESKSEEESLFNKIKALFSANSNAKEEADPMKELIINALKAAGKPTDGMTDEQLLTAYNEHQAEEKKPDDKEKAKDKPEEKEEKKEQAQNNEEIPAWAKALTEQVTALNSQINANSDKEKAGKREAVKAKFGLEDTAVNALDGAALDGLYAQCVESHGLNGQFQHNNKESISNMPE
jgi:hypothetical protein